MHVLHRTEKVRADTIHFIHKTQSRYFKSVRLTPHRFRLRLHAVDRTDDGNRTVKHTQRALDFGGKIDMPRRIDDIDLKAAPFGRRRRTRNRNAARLFLRQKIHRCLSVVDFADFVNFLRIIEDALRRRRFSRVDVRHDSDIAYFIQLHNASI